MWAPRESEDRRDILGVESRSTGFLKEFSQVRYEISAIISFLAVALLVALYLAVYLARTREHRGSRWMLATLGALSLWVGTYLLELLAVDREAVIFWANVQFVGIGSGPLLWYITVRYLLGERPAQLRFIAPIAVIPIVTVALAFGGLLRGHPELVPRGRLMLLAADYGWWHNFVFLPYQYLLYGAALYLLLRKWRNSNGSFGRRYVAIAGAMAMPMVGGGLYAVGVGPFQHLNPTSFLLTLTFLIVLLVVRRHRMFDLLPVARERLVDMLGEAIFVINRDGSVVDANPAVQALFPELPETIIDAELTTLLAEYPEMQLLAQGMTEEAVAFSTESEEGRRYFLGRGAQVRGLDGEELGRAISVTEITEATRLLRQREEATTNQSQKLASPKRFYAVAGKEIERARYFRRPLRIGVIEVGATTPEIETIVRRELGKYEWASHLGDGTIAWLFPDRTQDEVEKRLSVVGLKLEGETETAVRLGSAALSGDESGDSDVEKLIITAARTSRPMTKE